MPYDSKARIISLCYGVVRFLNYEKVNCEGVKLKCFLGHLFQHLFLPSITCDNTFHPNQKRSLNNQIRNLIAREIYRSSHRAKSNSTVGNNESVTSTIFRR